MSLGKFVPFTDVYYGHFFAILKSSLERLRRHFGDLAFGQCHQLIAIQ
jgi:hypothetical protein